MTRILVWATTVTIDLAAVPSPTPHPPCCDPQDSGYEEGDKLDRQEFEVGCRWAYSIACQLCVVSHACTVNHAHKAQELPPECGTAEPRPAMQRPFATAVHDWHVYRPHNLCTPRSSRHLHACTTPAHGCTLQELYAAILKFAAVKCAYGFTQK
jgi:hypothetical protein